MRWRRRGVDVIRAATPLPTPPPPTAVWRYARNNYDAYVPPNCPRCGQPAKFDWRDVTNFFADPVPMASPGRHWCETPGCVDENGYNVVPSRPA